MNYQEALQYGFHRSAQLCVCLYIVFAFLFIFCCKVNKEIYAVIYLDWLHISKQTLPGATFVYTRCSHKSLRVLEYFVGIFSKTLVVISPEAVRALGEHPFRSQRRTTALKSLLRPLLVALAYKASDSRPLDNLPSARPDAPVLLHGCFST